MERIRNERGFTYIEAIIASALVLVLAYLVMTLSKSGVAAQDYSSRMARVTEITQELTESLREDAQSSIRLFGNDAIGNAYVGLLDFSTMPVASAAVRLPQINESGVFEPDTASTTRTGNSLCLARHAWSDEFQTTQGNTHRIDVYRMVYYYVTDVDGGPQPDNAIGLNLAQWVSEPLADGNQIDNIDDAIDRAEVCEHLRTGSPDTAGNTHSPVQVVWKVGDDPSVADTLRQIIANGALVSSQQSPRPATGWAVYPDASRSRAGTLRYRHHSLASNYAPRICGVGRFGFVSTSGAGFPHGFETQIIGPASARQILIHLSVVSTRQGRLAYQEAQVVTDARDL